MQGKRLEAVREHLEKCWDNKTVLPADNTASFDTGHTLEERVANYKKLRELAVSVASKSPIKPLPRNPEFFSKCPSLQEIRRCWEIDSFKAEVEKAIANHPEWGYQVADGHILNRPSGGCRSMTGDIAPLRCVVEREHIRGRIWRETLECEHQFESTWLARPAKRRRCPHCLPGRGTNH